MREKPFRITALVLAVCMLFASSALPAQAYNPGGVDYVNTYINTGNQRQDIIGVALTQVGYMEGDRNDTKYGDWYGLAHDEWCAMFVSWCARQAEVSTDILYKTSWAHPKSFKITEYAGSEYTPQPGDLFFTDKYEHVGLVWYVEGDFFYSIEGNAKPHDYTVPNDPTVESYHVMTNKRLISAHTFGVPAYEGCDRDHEYTRGYNASHPHKVYYACNDCGDKYYTGYTECVAGCGSCFSCGCSSSHAGYYALLPNTDYLRMRTGHSWDSDTICYVTLGSVVYVHGISSGGWAYIEFDGIRGHIPASYLKKYPDPPAAPAVTAAQTEYIQNDNVTVSWNTPANTEQHRLKVFRDGELYLQEQMGLLQTCTLEALPPGTYEVQVTACNRAGASEAGVLEFVVRDTYTVTYDARQGSGAPESQTQVIGEAVTLRDTVPTREGYTFLGWTEDSGGSVASYGAGDTLLAVDDVTLYAVWRDNGAVPQALTVRQAPDRTMYLLQDSLDTSGLVLQLTYSDGAGHTVTEGFSVSGFDSETLGTKTLAISYAGLTATCEVQVVPYIPGDIDANRVVNRDDVMQLLWHITFPDRFPIEVPADFNGDGAVNRDDVMQLLWHITFPDRFPLEVEWPEETPAEPTEPAEAVDGSEDPQLTDSVEAESTQSTAEGE